MEFGKGELEGGAEDFGVAHTLVALPEGAELFKVLEVF